MCLCGRAKLSAGLSHKWRMPPSGAVPAARLLGEAALSASLPSPAADRNASVAIHAGAQPGLASGPAVHIMWHLFNQMLQARAPAFPVINMRCSLAGMRARPPLTT